MAGDEAFLMTSLVLIIAIFLRRRRRFFPRVRLMSRGMERTLRIMVIRTIQNTRYRRNQKTVWVYPRPQFWFEQLLLNRYQDHLWREHFRVSSDTFQHICCLVDPQLMLQNTILREAIIIEKRVAVALWRLATGISYRSVGLTLRSADVLP